MSMYATGGCVCQHTLGFMDLHEILDILIFKDRNVRFSCNTLAIIPLGFL